MKQLALLVQTRLAKHKTTLPKFLFIGVLKTFSAIFLNWLFIDIIAMDALTGSGIAYTIVFIGTYIAYVKSKTIHRGFVKYTIVVLAFNGLAVLMVTFMVNHLNMAGYSSSSVTTAVLVLLRYVTLHRFGIINTSTGDNRIAPPNDDISLKKQ
ncbi:MAG: hypothetical protein JXR76_16540 [Deltaproteobacteria bacterium]|nr:hypothetical protein [Deltaproteobacteria bacterium]